MKSTTHLFFAQVFQTMNTKILYPAEVCASLSCRLTSHEVSVRISDFIFETTVFDLPFQCSYLLSRVWNGDWLLRVGGCDCEFELTFFTLRLLEHRFISAVSQFFFELAFHLQCVAAQGTIWCCYLFFFHLVSFSPSKVKFMWAPPSLPFMRIFPMCDMRSGIWKRRGDSVDFTKVDL